ncbi:GMC family oxidoreductase [Pollutimonas harenae]|uniref:GMC family oxidoreductase N-terminal domain-containing protein n=1 Tax=Pollutimonas harenae TaxID=657015 RepID=A0A853H2A3_9BURK|nr:GMC family oxidoreductase N-terminal domain-containing protein [Pollutimonas harenae]NYT84703.1 GMC family oxidoreductase N-terminal domain-containing protein [Pollutimonas harenae]TEA72894.1 choline dehydrogenase [Pollutimonas harenae]
MADYDYIIAGGGTAGCILANRLSADGRYRVLLVEAGQDASSMWVHIPAGFSKLMVNPRFNWGFQTEPEENVHGRTIAVPRGKGLGGSTLINGMIYVRGQAQDYDAWQAAGAQGWGYDQVEPYFCKLENYAGGGEARGNNGPMHLEQVAERFPISDAFLQAAKEDGQRWNDDYNDGDQEGFGYYQVVQHKGRRWSIVEGYLNSARQRKNLSIESNAHVLRLILEGKRCVGLVYRKDGQEISVKAKRETLLCLGAIQTPQLLELSGVGDPDVIRAQGIPLAHGLEGVGANYIDHFATRMNWRAQNTTTLNEMSRGLPLACQVARYYLQRKGILTLGTGLVHGFVKTSEQLQTPDVQYFFVHASYANAANRVLDKEPGMTIGVAQLRPESRGTIHIKSPNPLDGPAIRPNFLDAAADRESLVKGMQLARRIVGQPAMQRYVSYEMNPGKEVDTFDEWLEFARQTGQTIYHPIGTCRMGNDDKAVTDPRLRIRGMDGVRVVDASVMPLMVSGNTQAAVMMVAEKGADMILQDAQA